MSAWAIIDPNWGEPVVLLSTIRATEDEAWAAACLSDERATNLYSGAHLHCVPQHPGTKERLMSNHYRASRVEVRMVE